MLNALKHFVVVGLLFALVLGWLLTLLVNSVVGGLIDSAIHQPATTKYWASLLLTVISVALIGGAIYAGNRVFRQHMSKRGAKVSIGASTALFSLIPISLAGPELLSVFGRITEHMHHYYNNGEVAVMELSLPLIRLLILPSMYFLIGWSMLGGHKEKTLTV